MTDRPAYALALHGGAGVKPGRDYGEVEIHLAGLIAEGEARLQEGENALDVVEAMVAALEASGLYVAGRGSAPSTSGRYELDAAIMVGRGPRAGAVAAVCDTVSAIRAARAVLDETPYVMLAGAGADAFCRDRGLALTAAPEDWYRIPVGVTEAETREQALHHGTVGAVALDRDGRLASATSTGGLFGKAPGRVGDTPVLGAGTWASERVAVSCTGVGEYFLLAGVAQDVDARLGYAGASLAEAAAASLAQIADLGGDGGLIAVDAAGELALPYNSPGMKRAWVRAGEPARVCVYQAPHARR